MRKSKIWRTQMNKIKNNSLEECIWQVKNV